VYLQYKHYSSQYTFRVRLFSDCFENYNEKQNALVSGLMTIVDL